MGVFVYHRILFHHFPFLINSKSLLTAAKCDSAVVASWPGNQALNNEMKEGMEVLMEAYPVTRKIWKEWCEEDKRLSLLTEEERMNLVSRYQWLFPKEESDFVDLEFLYTRKHIKSSREKFHKFFFVVCNRMFTRPFFGYGGYYQFMKSYQREFKEKCTSELFSKRVLLALAILGYIKELDVWYSYNLGSDRNRPNHYLIDKEKLLTWGDKEKEEVDNQWISYKRLRDLSLHKIAGCLGLFEGFFGQSYEKSLARFCHRLFLARQKAPISIDNQLAYLPI